MADKMRRMEDANEKLQNTVPSLKSRSMRDNLVLSGITEQRWEDTNTLLKDFLQKNKNSTTKPLLNVSTEWVV